MPRRLRAAALGYFWLPCPSCGEHFSGEEWVIPTRPGDHFSSIPTEIRRGDDRHWVRASKGICPDCTYAGVGCRAHAEHRIYHPACEAVPPPEGAAPYAFVWPGRFAYDVKPEAAPARVPPGGAR